MAVSELANLEQKTADPWRNRIVRTADMPLDALRANPKNWRTHPQAQRDALSGVLRDVGLVQTVIFNERTGLLVDGHARVEEAAKAGQATLPVSVVDLSDEEESLILATFDPIGAMAGANAASLDTLMREVSSGDAAVQTMLANLHDKVLPPTDPRDEWQGMPEFVQEDKEAAYKVMVNFRTKDDVIAFEQAVGQSIGDASRQAASIWYPEQERERRVHLGYASDGDDS